MRRLTYLLTFLFITASTVNAQRQFINPAGLSKPTSYTHVVVAGNTIYISGQVAANEKGEVVGKGNLEEQTRKVFENLKICLQSAGVSFSDVVKTTTFVVNLNPESLAVVRSVRKDYLPAQDPPTSTLLGVQALANPDYLIEIEAIAVKK